MSFISEEIILRSFQHTATPEETATLNKWLKEDKKNVEHYFRLEEIWNSNKRLSEPAISSGWNKLLTEIEKRPQPKQINFTSGKQKIPLWIRYAAAVFIGAVIASAIFRQNQKAADTMEIPVRNIVCNRTGVQPVLFPDSSQAWLNGPSRISYPDRFDPRERIVLLEGKAYFNIQKEKGKSFIIRSENIDIEVTGTELFVDFSFEKRSTVTLISGKVNVHARNNEGNRITSRLVPGQQAEINQITGEIAVTTTETDFYTAWKDGTYRFTDVPLEKIADLVSRYYNIEIQLDPSLKKKRFTGRITPDNDMVDIMNIISKSLPIRYKITDEKVIVSPW